MKKVPKIVNTSNKVFMDDKNPYHIAYFKPLKSNEIMKELNIDKDLYKVHQYYSVSRRLNGETQARFAASVVTKTLFGYDYYLANEEVIIDITEETKDMHDIDKIADLYFVDIKDLLVKKLKSSEEITKLILDKDIKDFIKDSE